MRIGLVAGEASGDILGTELIRAIRARVPDAEFRGIAGPMMAAAGCEPVYSSDELAVMGLVEVLGSLPRLLSVRRGIRAAMRAWQPDVFIGIDSPDFNLSLERDLRAGGIRTVHYVSPTVWAWRPGRVKSVARAADRVLTLFPFESAHYDGSGVEARFVGHPLADVLVPSANSRASARKALGLADHETVIAVLPGSRAQEIDRLGPVFAETIARLAVAGSSLRFVSPMVSDTLAANFSAMLERAAPQAKVLLTRAGSRPVLAAADLVLLASGTAALEAMLLEKPMVVAYRLSPVTAWLLRTFNLLRVDTFSLPNLLAGAVIVPEFIQERATPEALTGAMSSLLASREAQATQRAAFSALRVRLSTGGGSAAADAVLELAKSPRPSSR